MPTTHPPNAPAPATHPDQATPSNAPDKQPTGPSQGRWRALVDRVPMTWQGALLLLVCGVVLQRYGFVEQDWILLVIGLFGVALTLLSCLSVGIASLYLGWRLRKLNRGRTHLPILTDTSQPAISGFLLPRFVPPMIDFFGYWESPQADVVPATLFPDRTEEIRFAHRGYFEEIVRVFEVRDLFGLAEVRWKIREPRQIEVWPQMHGHQPPFVQAFSDGDEQFVPTRPRRGDLVDTRQYQPGDSIRLIHWKMFARSGIPIVRAPEPSAAFERQMVAYLISDQDDDFAAQVARYALESGGLGRDWHFGADRGDDIATQIHVARRLLARSGTRPSRHGHDLDSFLQKLAFNPESQRLILYASGGLHRWFPVMEPLLKRFGSVTTLIIANEVATEIEAWKALRDDNAPVVKGPRGTPWWKRLLLRPQEHKEETKEAEAIDPWGRLRALAKEGLQIQLLQPPQGTPLGQAAPGSGQRGGTHRPKTPPPPGTPPPRGAPPQRTPMRSAPPPRMPPRHRPPGSPPGAPASRPPGSPPGTGYRS